MLATPIITAAMLEQGLSQADLAAECGVSRTAVSNWLAGESIPRPAKLRILAGRLGLPISDLVQGNLGNEVDVYPAAPADAVRDMANGLRSVMHFLPAKHLFVRPLLKAPRLDAAYLDKVAGAVRSEFDTFDSGMVRRLLTAHRKCGTHLVPVREPHDGLPPCVFVYARNEAVAALVFNLDAGSEGLELPLARALGYSLSHAALGHGQASLFGQLFAEALLEQEHGRAGPLAVGQDVAGPAFPGYVGLSTAAYVSVAEWDFKTPIFQALRLWQQAEGGRSPAFLRATLGMNVVEALALSYALWPGATMPPPQFTAR